ncbi:CLUMA_CG017213, isoform A [Clunio marinus]|uniref:CLUMA_CG017213, isoform A n=1 Tax=Clunio marinus TaxID=568069 RepID=A0A1J1IX16_9DIPT|nr:CLUMA_CG017213, isoform A [Clunio marinus]
MDLKGYLNTRAKVDPKITFHQRIQMFCFYEMIMLYLQNLFSLRCHAEIAYWETAPTALYLSIC